MTFSVVIATYGNENWREIAWSRAYPSAVGQTEDVVVHHDDGESIAQARNRAASMAKGEWLIFLDGDDELQADYVLGMQQEVERDSGAQGGFCRSLDDWASYPLLTPAVQYIRRGRPQDPMFWPEVDLRLGNWLIIGTAIHRLTFDALGGFRDYPHGLEDFDLWSRAHKAGCKVVKVPRSIYIVHWNERSKHRELQRNRKLYMKHYHEVCRTNWPELYENEVA